MADQVKIKVGVEQSAVKTGLAHIRNQFAGLKSFAAGRAGAVMAAAGASGFGLVGALQLFKASFEKAGNIADMSERFDVSAEALQRIGVVAEQSGVSMEGVAGALNKLAINGEKIAGGDKAGAAALEDLGINAAEFIKLDTEGKFNAISAAVSTAQDQSQAYAAVVQLMGRSAGELYSTLALGPDAIKAQGDAIGVMSDDAIKKLDALGDKITALKNKVLGMAGNALGKFAGLFIGDDDPDVQRAAAERKAKAAAARGERTIEEGRSGSGKEKREIVADALTRAGGGGTAYMAPDKNAAEASAKSLAEIEKNSALNLQAMRELARRMDPMRAAPTPPLL